MDDLSWILADGESLEDALEDFAEDVANPERVKRRHDAIRALADPLEGHGHAGLTDQELYDHENPPPLENPMDWEK